MMEPHTETCESVDDSEAGASDRWMEQQQGALPLFREIPSVINSYGAPFRTSGIGTWTVTLLLLVVAIGVGLLLTLGRYARKETVAGTLEPTAGAARIVAPRSGTVQSVFVVEGQTISAGAPILTIGSTSGIRGGVSLDLALEAASAAQRSSLSSQLDASLMAIRRQAEELGVRRNGLRVQIERLGREKALWEQRRALDISSLRSFETLRESGYVSEIRLKEQQKQVIAGEQAALALEREEEAAKSAMAEVALQLEQLNAEADRLRAQHRGSDAALDERRAGQLAEHHTVMTAPIAGRVVALQTRPGSATTEAATLATILPQAAKLEARLWAPSRAVGFLRTGDRVRLLYDSFPYQRFGPGGGRIVAIASAPTSPADLPLGVGSEEPMYLIRVTLESQQVNAYGRAWQLAPGSRVSADLVLESQSLLDWLLDPIRAVQRRAAG